ncbi:MAG: hypothetical protein UHX00_06665 [Caryophanon sp.]|nr:hypothetical protein [Caryophanon sp.]
MKRIFIIIPLVLMLAACNDEGTTKEVEAEDKTETKNANQEFTEELIVELDEMEFFEQKSVAKEKDITLISIGDIQGEFSDEEKITVLSNYSNVYTLLEFDHFIAQTLLNDYTTMENPTKTFEWALYADSIFLSYVEQIEFDQLNRKQEKFYEGVKDTLIKSVNNRQKLVQAWLDYSKGKDTDLTIDEIKLNLSEENLYAAAITLGMAFGIHASENIGTYDVSNYTAYGNNQIELANSSIKRILLKYYELVALPAGMTLDDLVKNFKEEENQSTKEYETGLYSDDELAEEKQALSSSALDEIPEGAFNTVETARTQIGYTIAYYLDSYVQGDTSSLAYMIHPSTEFYQSQVNYLESLNNRGITMDLIDFSIVSMETLSKHKYKVTVDEIYLIDNPEKGSKEVQQTSYYTVELIDGEFYITSLTL